MSKNLSDGPIKVVIPKLAEEILEVKKVSSKPKTNTKQEIIDAYGAAVDYMINGSKEDFSVKPAEMGQKVIELVRAYNSIPDEYWLFYNAGTPAARKSCGSASFCCRIFS